MIKIITILQSWTKYLQTFLPFNTIETELFYYHQKVTVWVSLQFVEQLKTYDLRKLGIFKNTPAMLGIEIEYPAS